MVVEAHQGRDTATLEVVVEAASLLIYGQLEGLGVHPGHILRGLGRAVHLQLWRFSHPWWWLSHPTHICLRQLSNCPHLLQLDSSLWLLLRLNSRLWLLLCCLWPLLRPPIQPWTFLWCPSHPLPELLLWLPSRPQLPVRPHLWPPYLITHAGKLPAWQCLLLQVPKLWCPQVGW